MPFSIRYDQEDHIIFASVEGELNLDLLKEMATEVSQHIKEHDCKNILNDLREAIPTQTCLDIYDMPKKALSAGVAPDVRRALVVKEFLPGFQFLETVFINQFNSVQMFKNFSEAKSWLMED